MNLTVQHNTDISLIPEWVRSLLRWSDNIIPPNSQISSFMYRLPTTFLYSYLASYGIHLLALFVQQVEECCGFLADEVEAAAVVDVFDVVPGDALCPVLLLQGETQRKWVSKYLKGRWVTQLRQTQHLLRNLEVSICWLFVTEQLHRNSWRFAFLDAFSWRIKWKGPRFFQHWGIQGDKPALNLTKRHPDYSNKKKSVASLQYKTN